MARNLGFSGVWLGLVLESKLTFKGVWRLKNTPYFIAEVSSNHHQDLDRCLAFIDTAADIGCDAVKFQLFKIDKLFAPEILDRSAKHRARSQWELPESFLPKLRLRCDHRGIDFSCTPFDLEAVEALKPYVSFYKIASYELLWSDLLRACGATSKPVILSTGMANLDEIMEAVGHLSDSGCQDLKLLHCSSAYPTPPEAANLAAMMTIARATGCAIGWSDHTRNPGVIHRAIHRWGASVIEFHLDLEGKGGEYEAGHCWLPDEMAAVIKGVRDAFAADGHGRKEPNKEEMPDRDWRADPFDGLRPLSRTRAQFKGDRDGE